MCGILYCKIKSSAINTSDFREVFSTALNKMAYRGPDAKGIEIIGSNYFGHVRLSIVDLENTSNQPIQDDRNLMIFNGEIYNYKELDPVSSSDTKTLFNCMQEMDAPFKKIKGMYAFGWFEKSTGRMTFYRDFFGEKPLYYFNDADVCIVSSTLKSIKVILQNLNKKAELNRKAITTDFMLFGYIREPETIYNEIKTLSPGHILSVDNKNVITVKPNKFHLEKESYVWTESNYVSQALASKDVSGTLLLSGGVDSTFILSKAAENNISLRLGVYKAKQKEIDESTSALSNYEKIVADKSIFPVTVLSADTIGIDDINEYCSILEQPTSDGLQLFHLLKHLRRKDESLKLVYTGLGGDEIFGGYPSFYNYKLINLLVHIPFSEIIIPKLKRFKLGKKILEDWNVNIYAFLYRIDLNMFALLHKEADLKQIYNDYLAALDYLPKQVAGATSSEFMSIKNNEMYQYALNQLLRDNDNISMYLGFESRSPLLNPDWYFQHDNNKARMKNALLKKYNITFGAKKGFTLDEKNTKNFFIDIIKSKNGVLKEFLPQLSHDKLDLLSIKKLRSLMILLLWIEKNDSK